MEVLKIENSLDQNNIIVKTEKKKNILKDIADKNPTVYLNCDGRIYGVVKKGIDVYLKNLISIDNYIDGGLTHDEMADRFDLVTNKILKKEDLQKTDSYIENKENIIDYIQAQIKEDITLCMDYLLYKKEERRTLSKKRFVSEKKNNYYKYFDIKKEEEIDYIRKIKEISEMLLTRSGRVIISAKIDEEIELYQNKIVPDFGLNVGDTVYILSFLSTIDELINSNQVYKIYESEVESIRLYNSGLSYKINPKKEKDYDYYEKRISVSLRANLNGVGNYYANKNCFLFLSEEDAKREGKEKIKKLKESINRFEGVTSF